MLYDAPGVKYDTPGITYDFAGGLGGGGAGDEPFLLPVGARAVERKRLPDDDEILLLLLAAVP